MKRQVHTIHSHTERNGLQEKLNSACHDMEIPVDFKIDSEDIASRIKAAVDGITDIELDLKVNTDSVRQAVDENLKKIEPEVDESGLTQLQQALHNINTAGQQSQSVFSSLGSTFKEAFSAYSLANVMQDMLYKIADGAREAVGTVKELNDSITSLEMATGENYNTVKQMMSQYNEMGQELGSITTDIAEGADSWLRQGKSVQETNQLLKDSMVLSKVSDLRSYHMVYQFHSDKKETYNKNMFIEIQLRTKLQHIWATAVEMMGIYTHSNLKSSQGDEDILRFFTVVSSIFAIQENQPVCPGTSDWLDELLDEMHELDKKHNILKMLEAMKNAAHIIKPKFKNTNGYFLLVLNLEDHNLTIQR